MKIVTDNYKQFILAHNNQTDSYMILTYRNTGSIRGYVNMFDNSVSVIFNKGGRTFGWDIIKTTDTLVDLIEGIRGVL